MDGLEGKHRRCFLAGILVLLVLAVVLGVQGFLHQRERNREEGNAYGYTTGYSIGYTDYLNGTKQSAQKLAGKIVPYEPGTVKWKYFIMGFDAGYADGLSGGLVCNINES